MNANFGLLAPLERPPRDRQRRKQALVDRALAATDEFARALDA
jgi:folate-dependent tRNA-U54 methylase TrmFO/GidA